MAININLNPAFMGGMSPMGGMSQMFMMMQMMQMMQMMMSMMGPMSYGGGMGGGCGCHQGFGQSLGMPGMGHGGMPMMPMPMPMPNGGYPPMSNWGGGAPPIDPGMMQGTSRTGQTLMGSIMNSPVPPGCSPGYCYRGVKHHLRQVGVNLQGGSAYQAADQLAAQPHRFREVTVSRDQLRRLPPGAVVVWNKSPGHQHGHISIAMGNGKEASDKIRNQMVNRNASYRVFMPVS
mgnify:CR=1 FL=1